MEIKLLTFELWRLALKSTGFRCFSWNGSYILHIFLIRKGLIHHCSDCKHHKSMGTNLKELGEEDSAI